MKYIREKVAFIEGLAEGLELDVTTKEGKVIDKIIEVLGDITDALDGLAEAQENLEEYAEMIDEDLEDMEDFFLETDWDDVDLEDDDDYYEVVCPNCHNVYITDFESFEDDEVFCPECGAQFSLEQEVVDELTHGEGCQCGCHDE